MSLFKNDKDELDYKEAYKKMMEDRSKAVLDYQKLADIKGPRLIKGYEIKDQKVILDTDKGKVGISIKQWEALKQQVDTSPAQDISKHKDSKFLKS